MEGGRSLCQFFIQGPNVREIQLRNIRIVDSLFVALIQDMIRNRDHMAGIYFGTAAYQHD